MRARSLLSAVGVCLFLAACQDVSAPRPDPLLSGVRTTVPKVLNSVNILTQSLLAPPLQNYSLSFWVVQGRGKTVVVDYQPDAFGVARHFLSFVVPSGTQLVRPDGSPVLPGDSVQITADIDASKLLIQFAPHGLGFGGTAPARLQVYYGLANLDLNGDGLINDLDSQIISTLLVISYQATDGDPWVVGANQNKSLSAQTIEIAVPHFSRYAVSW